MDAERLVSITISIPKVCRDQLRRIAAETNLKILSANKPVGVREGDIFCILEKPDGGEEGGIRNEQSTFDC